MQATPTRNWRVWSAVSCRRAAASASSASAESAASDAPKPASATAAMSPSGATAPGTNSTAALSAAKLTAAWTTPGTFLFRVRSIVAAQLAQLMPVIPRSTRWVGTA